MKYRQIIAFSLLLFAISLLMVGIVKGNTIEYPSEVYVDVGTYNSGNVASFNASDDTYYDITEIVGTPGASLLINFTSTSFTMDQIWFITFEYNYTGSAGHTLNLEIYNNSAWETVFNVPESTETNITYYLNSHSTMITSGEIRYRLYHSSPGNINHDILIDYFKMYEGDVVLNRNFVQESNINISGDLWTTTYDYYTADYNLKTGHFIGNSSGTLYGNSTILNEHLSLTINTGFTYSAPIEVLITNENSNGYCIETSGTGIITHNNGLFTVESGSTFINPKSHLWDLHIDSTSWIYAHINTFYVDNNFTLDTTLVFSPWSQWGVFKNVTVNTGELRKWTNPIVINGFLDVYGEVTEEAGAIPDFTVVGLTTVYSGGIIDFGNEANTISFGSLFINTGGEVSLSTYSTEITSNSGQFALNNDGILNMPSGHIRFSDNTSSNFVDMYGPSGDYFNDVIIDCGIRTLYLRNTPNYIDGDLWLESGNLDVYTEANDFTILGNVIINNSCQLGDNDNTGTWYMNSLTINSGGTFEAPKQPGETIITGRNDGSGNRAIDINNGGILNNNSGVINFTFNSNTNFNFWDQIPYDVVVNCITFDNVFLAIHIGHDFIINTGTVRSNGKDLRVDNYFNITSGSSYQCQNGDLDVYFRLNIWGILYSNNPSFTGNGLWFAQRVRMYTSGELYSTENIFQINTEFDNDGNFIHNNGTVEFKNSGGISRLFGDFTGDNAFYIVQGHTDGALSQIYQYTNVDVHYKITNGGGSAGSTQWKIETNNTILTLGTNFSRAYVDCLYFDGSNGLTQYVYGANINYPALFNDTIQWARYFGRNQQRAYMAQYAHIKWLEVREPIISPYEDNLPRNLIIDGLCTLYDVEIRYYDSIDFRNQNLIINGTFNTINLNETRFLHDNGNLTINGFWDLNNNLTELDLNNFIINGEVNFYNYSLQSNSNMIIYLNNNSFRTSTGELNVSASISYPLRLIGNINNTSIDLNNMTDYFLFNVETKNLTNIDTEYIVLHGNDIGNLSGLWDFLPPIINYLNLTNNTIFTKSDTNLFNMSFYLEELSYLHSYEWEIIRKSDGYTMYNGSFNFSSPVNNTYKYMNYNYTFWQNNDYYFNITAYDTHNKLAKDAKMKDKLYETKFKVGKFKVGKYDNWTLKDKESKYVILENFYTETDLFTIEFMNTKETKHTITWMDNNDNFKLLHKVKLKDNYVDFMIKTEYSIYYIPQTNNFVINGMFFYDITDLILSGYDVTVSNKMIDSKYEYYMINIAHSTFNNTLDKFYILDPLSGGVNNNQTSYQFTINGSSPITSAIGFITPTGHAYVGDTVTFNGTYSGYGNVSKYVWISSIDGEFYNSTNAEFTNTNLTVGTHTITFFIIDEFGNTTISDTTSYIIAPIPIAKIVYAYTVGNTAYLKGGYTTVHNNTVTAYSWESNITGPFANTTINPLTVIFGIYGNHTISLRIKDQFGNWSAPITTVIYVSNQTVSSSADTSIWWESDSQVLRVIGMVFILVFILFIFMTVFRKRLS